MPIDRFWAQYIMSRRWTVYFLSNAVTLTSTMWVTLEWCNDTFINHKQSDQTDRCCDRCRYIISFDSFLTDIDRRGISRSQYIGDTVWDCGRSRLRRISHWTTQWDRRNRSIHVHHGKHSLHTRHTFTPFSCHEEGISTVDKRRNFHK